MKIVSVRAESFRSAKDVSLDRCGQYNVLIGRNNAGKSTLLMALDAFASAMRGPATSVIHPDPPVGDVIDFHGKETRAPILITVTFSLLTSEREHLLNTIRTAVPQLSSAVDAFPPEQLLVAQIGVAHKPRFSWLHELSLKGANSVAQSVLFRCGSDVAQEMHLRFMNLKSANTLSLDLDDLFRRIDSDDYIRMKATREQRGMWTTLLRRRAVEETSLQEFTSLIESTSTHQELRERIQARVLELVTDIESKTRQPYQGSVDTFAGPMNVVPPYVFEAKRMMASIKVLYMRERRAEIGAAEASRLLGLKTKRGGATKLTAIQETVESLLGVSIDAFSEGGPQKSPELDVDDFLVDVNGAGIREALRIVLDYEFENPQVLIVEEPEMHLHPALETSVARFLAKISNDCQVFIATHSTSFLDSSRTSAVFLVSKPRNGGSVVQQLSSIESMVKQVPPELGIRISSLFMYDRLVFVEGPSDEDVIREWAERQGVNLGLKGVGFVPLGGVGNLRYFAAEETLNFLSRRQVGLWFVIDRDERSELAMRDIQKKMDGKASVLFLTKRQMENYLLDPRAVQLLISEKQGVAIDRCPSIEDIAQKIDSAIESAQATVIERRTKISLLRPMFFDHGDEIGDIGTRIRSRISHVRNELDAREEKLASVIENTTREVHGEWTRRRTDIVDGASVLDTVMQSFGLRFHKERDSARLARTIAVPHEFQVMLSEIGGNDGVERR